MGISSLLKKSFGLEAAGVLGYDFLSRLVTKIDYANETLSFYHPDSFEYSGEGKVIEAPLEATEPIVPMTVDDRYSGKWRLDTGSGGLDFHFPFAKENNLLDLSGIDRMGHGAGGEIMEKISRYNKAELGGFVVQWPLISVPLQEGEGGFAHKGLAGNIGNSLLRNFVLFLDYKKQQVILEKGKDFGKKFPEDKSGLEIGLTEKGDWEVIFVSPGTPAYKGGFDKGDIVKSINGIKIDYFEGIVSIRKLLREEAGTEYTLKILRDGKTEELTLKLEELY